MQKQLKVEKDIQNQMYRAVQSQSGEVQILEFVKYLLDLKMTEALARNNGKEDICG